MSYTLSKDELIDAFKENKLNEILDKSCSESEIKQMLLDYFGVNTSNNSRSRIISSFKRAIEKEMNPLVFSIPQCSICGATLQGGDLQDDNRCTSCKEHGIEF